MIQLRMQFSTFWDGIGSGGMVGGNGFQKTWKHLIKTLMGVCNSFQLCREEKQ